MVGHTLVGFVDNAMVGQLGTSELAAISLGNSFVFIAMSFGIGFSTAITPLVAESDAKKNIKTVSVNNVQDEKISEIKNNITDTKIEKKLN